MHWALTSKGCCKDKENAEIDIGRMITDKSSETSGIICSVQIDLKFTFFSIHRWDSQF